MCNVPQHLIDGYEWSEMEMLSIQTQTERTEQMLGKEFLNCEDLMNITGFGESTVRRIMKSPDFPLIKQRNRQIVGIAAFYVWEAAVAKKEKHNGNKT